MKAIFKVPMGILLGERPLPNLLKPDDVRIKIALAGLCRTDFYVAQGKIPVADQIILGHECSGFVEQIGSMVRGLEVGQAVTIMPVFKNNHQHSMLGVDHHGVYAESLVIPAHHVYPVPTELSLEEAAFIEPIAACIAVTKAPIHTQQRGLIYGTNRIAELTKRLLTVKGFKRIDVGTPELLDAQMNTYDFVIETQPTESAFATMVEVVKPNGLIVLKSRPFHSIPLPTTTIVRKEIGLTGVHYGDFQECIDLIATKQLQVRDLLGSTHTFEEALPILLGTETVAEDKKIFFKP